MAKIEPDADNKLLKNITLVVKFNFWLLECIIYKILNYYYLHLLILLPRIVDFQKMIN